MTRGFYKVEELAGEWTVARPTTERSHSPFLCTFPVH